MHAHLSAAFIAAAMLLLPLAALEASAHRPDPFPQDFQPTRPVYRIERHEADSYREGASAGARAGAGAGWGAGAGAGMTPSGWRRHSLERYDGYRYSSRDADGDGMPDRWDRHPRNPNRQ
jgi:hypothetical protein